MAKSHSPLRVLVVTAHPHDFTHSAGTCGIHTAQGDRVTAVSVTSGAYTHNERLHDELLKPEAERDPAIINQSPEEYAAIKADEFHQACALFGVTDVRILTFPQPFHLERYPEAIEALRDIILDVRPQVLITTSPSADGQRRVVSGTRNDHTESVRALMDARTLASGFVRDQQPHTIAATYFMGVYYQRDQLDFVVDVTDWFEQRVQAEGLFRSQGHTDAWARRRIELAIGNTGWFHGTMYAEGFVREQVEVLPRIVVPESALERADEPHKARQQRMEGEQEHTDSG